MATIQISKSYTMPLEEVKQGLEKIGKGLQEEHGLKYDWKTDQRVEFMHKAVKGFVEIRENEVRLEFRLGMMYAAMAPVVKKRINEMADKYIS